MAESLISRGHLIRVHLISRVNLISSGHLIRVRLISRVHLISRGPFNKGSFKNQGSLNEQGSFLVQLKEGIKHCNIRGHNSHIYTRIHKFIPISHSYNIV